MSLIINPWTRIQTYKAKVVELNKCCVDLTNRIKELESEVAVLREERELRIEQETVKRDDLLAGLQSLIEVINDED